MFIVRRYVVTCATLVQCMHPLARSLIIDERLDHPMTVPNVYGFDSR